MLPKSALSVAAWVGALVCSLLPMNNLQAASGDEAIVLATQSAPMNMDPHWAFTNSHSMSMNNMFDGLLVRAADLSMHPGLAVSWELVEPTVWELKLRKGVKFHSGEPFTARDVAYTWERAPNVPNAPAPYTAATKPVKEIQIVDDYTVRFITKTPRPQFVGVISEVPIVSESLREMSEEDIKAGKAVNGTGPYKFASYVPGESLELVRNDDYWGKKPAYAKAKFVFINNSGARISALLAGDVGVIDSVPLDSIERLKGEPKVKIWATQADRSMYLMMDQAREQPPQVANKDGSPITKNPMKDIRVREAMTIAIDREAICETLYYGFCTPANQVTVKGMAGYNADLVMPKYDPERAKSLLAEAGFPDGFAITLNASNDRYPLDREVAQVIAQMYAQIGVQVDVKTFPAGVFFSAATRREYALYQAAFGSSQGTAIHNLANLLMTQDKQTGVGAINRLLYSNAKADELGWKALKAQKQEDFVRYQEEMTRVIYEDYAIIPIITFQNIWATRKGVGYTPRTDERTLAMEAFPANK